MKYKMFQLSFRNGVHLGGTSLDESLSTFCADTLFSALYQEALKAGNGLADWLYRSASSGDLLLSDAFPCVDNRIYLPKPMIRPETADNEGDSVLKKAFKKLEYIPADSLDQYMSGRLDAKKENACLKKFAKRSLRTSASIPDGEETRPFHVGTVQYGEGCTPYFIAGLAGGEEEVRLRELLESLSFTGIGGKRNSGLGRFRIVGEEYLDKEPFEKNGPWKMALSICLPMDNELESALQGAHYSIKKRSGFVASESYATEMRKKKDLYMFTAGSCFAERFAGAVYDVSDGGAHPVYRYGKPLFWTL